MTKSNFVDEGDSPFFGDSSVRVRSVPSRVYSISLDGPIGEPREYRDEIDAFESASPWDDVRVRIVSGGGMFTTGAMLIDAIKACEAPVTAFIHEQCGSMATAIALACENWVLGEYAHFMIHAASFGVIGKAHEVESEHAFTQKQIARFLKNTYSGFLTPKEIQQVAGGRDMWIDTDELRERLQRYGYYRAVQRDKAQRKVLADQKKREKMNAKAVQTGESDS